MWKKIIYFFQKATSGRSENENLRHREYVLNILLVSSIILLSVCLIIDLAHLLFGDQTVYQNNSISLLVIFSIICFLAFLYFLSRKGLFRPASFFLIGIFFFLASYMGMSWGVDVNASILFYVLTLVMAGILIGARFAFFTTSAVILTIIGTDYIHRLGIIEANRYWRSDSWTVTDTIVMTGIFFIIAIVSWLSNREMEKSLARAVLSEAELKLERDWLEVKVKERTTELKKAQMEQISQLYHFAEFGKLSSGLFHDLVNPLTAASLNMDLIKDSHMKEIEGVRSYFDKASISIKRMEDFIITAREQMMNRKTESVFFLNDEIRSVIQILDYKAKKSDVYIAFIPSPKISIYGDSAKFSQIILNLAANAIDSYKEVNSLDKDRRVEIGVSESDGLITVSVKDWGCGIKEELMDKIFEPFFTTKDSAEGIGIGLSLTKNIAEKDFGGSISCLSEDGEGSSFSVSFYKDKRQQ